MANKRHAIINDQNEVVNVILWDGISPWQPPIGHTVVECDRVSIGDSYNHATKEFIIKERNSSDIPVIEPEKTLEERLLELEQKLSDLSK